MSEQRVEARDLGDSAGRVIRAYRFALDPTLEQETALRSHCGAQRFTYNWALATVKANLSQRAAESSYGLAGDELTPPLSWSAYDLRKQWNRIKGETAPWWPENSKEAYSSGIANVAAALKNWTDSRTGKRAGRPVGFPRFKGKRSRLSVRFTTGTFGLGDDRRHVKLPRIGAVRTHEPTRKLARRIEAGTARIRSATVSRSGGRWFVSFSVELERAQQTPRHPDSVIGVDVGVKSLAVLSTGEIIDNPGHHQKAQKRRRLVARQRARRRGPDRGSAPSNRWLRSNEKAVRLEEKVVNQRRDGLHKLTTCLAREHGTVVVEDLNVAGMLRNRRLARHIADAGFAELRRQLDYKTVGGGGTLLIADRWYPSSRTCSDPGCGAVKAKLRLSERIFSCDRCGLTLDRDLNAARNLAALASSASCVGTVKTRAGNHVRPGSPGGGTATSRPTASAVGQPCRSNPAGHGTEVHVS